jgi:hypothetical protein
VMGIEERNYVSYSCWKRKSRIIKMKLLEAQFSSGTSSFTARYPCDTVRICLYTRLASGHLR